MQWIGSEVALKARRQTGRSLRFVLCGLLASVPAWAARTIAEWESLFLASWPTEYDTYRPASLSGDSWQLYDLAYAIDANYAMFRATGHARYLDRALLYIENAIGAARLSSSFSTSQFKDGYLTWVNHSHPDLGSDGREYPLFESYCWRYVTSLLRVMQDRPGVADDTNYRARFEQILAFTERNIWEKWYRRGPANLYRSNAHMASHWAKIAMDLNLLSSDPEKKAQYRAVRDNITFSGLPGYAANGGLRGQLRAVDTPERYVWNENWGSTSAPGQDVAHGNAVVGYIVEAKDLGYHWADADIARLVATLTDAIWPSATMYRAYVDGSGVGNGWFNDGWCKLGRYSLALQSRLEAHGVGRNTQLYGNGALNARLLAECPPVKIIAQPESQTIAPGGYAKLAVEATRTAIGAAAPTPLAYQWFREGTRIAGAMANTLMLGPVTTADNGSYAVEVTTPEGALMSEPARVQVAAAEPSRLINLSVRCTSGDGDATAIAGFVVAEGATSVLVRAMGPALASFGVAGALADPRLAMFEGETNVAANDNWNASTDVLALLSAFRHCGAFEPAPASLDAALLAPANGSRTAHATGGAGQTGVVLIEIYDAGRAAGRLVNLSSRTRIAAGETLIAGFVIDGNVPRRMLIRGVGPSLVALGVAGTLVDPVLRLHDGSGAVVAENDNWSQATDAPAIATASARVGAFPLEPGNRDAALLRTLSPGLYSVHLYSAGVAGGIALIELYDVR